VAPRPAVLPLAAGGRTLASWEEFDGLIRQRSAPVREAAGHVLEAEGQARQRLAQVLPQLGATLSGTQQLLLNEQNYLGLHISTTPDPSFTWQAGATVRVPLFVPRGWYDYGTSSRTVKGARLLEQDAKRRALALAVDHMLALAAAEQLYRVGLSSLEVAKSVQQLTEKALAQGYATSADVLRAGQEVSAIEIRNVRLTEDVIRARGALGSALGLPVQATPASGMSPASAFAHVRSVCRALPSVDDRADVAAARVSVEASARDVTSARLAYLPTLEAFSTVTYNSEVSIYVPEKVNLSTNGLHTTWVAGGVLSFPLFDGGSRYGQQQESRGQLQVAEAQLQAARQGAAQEAQVAALVVDAAAERSAAAHANARLALETKRLTELAYHSGQGSSFDLLESTRRMWLAEVDLVLAEVGLVGAKVGQALASASCEL
jgi:outer membrane protein TolC